MPMPVVYMLEEFCELLLVIVIPDCGELPQVFE